MIRSTCASTFVPFMVTLALGLGMAAHAEAAATSFVEPGHWTVGDVNTTYQEWDTFGSTTDNVPDVGSVANPSITADATVDALPPGFVAGSGNFYSFSADYSFTSDIYNHGGSAGVGSLATGLGTHVIVQTSASLNETLGVLDGTLELVDLAGGALAGGDHASALRHDVIFDGMVSGPLGPTTQREEVWEFYLPNYVGDFQVRADLSIHSNFDQVRVDTAIAPSAFATTAIPEPTSLALLAVTGGLAMVRRRR